MKYLDKRQKISKSCHLLTKTVNLILRGGGGISPFKSDIEDSRWIFVDNYTSGPHQPLKKMLVFGLFKMDEYGLFRILLLLRALSLYSALRNKIHFLFQVFSDYLSVNILDKHVNTQVTLTVHAEPRV
jgi:hypothetical protein